jgi:hypothetical protein
MANKTSITSTKVAKKAAAKRVDAKAAKQRLTAPRARPGEVETGSPQGHATTKEHESAFRFRRNETRSKSQSRKVAKPTLLAGGNPQIAKAYGDAPVQATIAAMPGWKNDVGRRLDALIVRTVPSALSGKV